MIGEYVKWYAASGVQPSSARQCGDKLNYLFRLLGNYGVSMEDDRITGLDGRVLAKFYADFSESRKISTRNNYVCFLNPFLKWAHNTGRIGEDLSGVLKVYKLPSEDATPKWEKKEKYLSAAWVEELMRTMPGRNKTRDRAICALFLGAGLRTSELCGLTIGSVLNQPRGTLYLKRKGGVWKETEVSDFVYPYLDAYLKTRSDLSDPTRPLFVTSHGQPANPNQVYKAIRFKQRAIDKKAGSRTATGAHTFRHTFVSTVERQNGAGVARDLANHKSIRITNVYDHTTAEERRNAVNSLPWARK